MGDRSVRRETARVDGSWLVALVAGSRRSVIQLDRRARIVAANDRARALLAKDEGLADEDGFLSATAPRDDRELQRLLARAAPSLGTPGSSGSMTIARSSARTRLVVHVVPVAAREWELGAKQVAVLVLVTDPESRPRIDDGLVQAALGLTPAESRLAIMVAAGQRVRALNAQGSGEPSNVAEGETNAARPGQPRHLRARATGPTTITLAWEAPASDGGERITGYTIRARGPGDGTWITIVRTTGSTATTFEHTGLQPASAYRYQVAAINRVGAGQWSFAVPRFGARPDTAGATSRSTTSARGSAPARRAC